MAFATITRAPAGPTVLAAGSVDLLAAPFLPVSNRGFPEPSPARRIAAIEAAPGEWLAAQILFGLGRSSRCSAWRCCCCWATHLAGWAGP